MLSVLIANNNQVRKHKNAFGGDMFITLFVVMHMYKLIKMYTLNTCNCFILSTYK